MINAKPKMATIRKTGAMVSILDECHSIQDDGSFEHQYAVATGAYAKAGLATGWVPASRVDIH